MKTLRIIALTVLVPSAALACPKLKNEDTRPYEYTLTCAGAASRISIKAGETQTLTGKGKQRCTLALQGGAAFTLTAPMNCIIKNGALACVEGPAHGGKK